MQEYLRVDAPIAGFMPASAVHQGHATLCYADYIRPGVECEVAVRLQADLPPGPCYAGAGAGSGRRVLRRDRAGGEPLHRCAGIGRADAAGGPDVPRRRGDRSVRAIKDWRQLDLTALRGSITLSDGSSDTGITSDLLGHPLKGLALLAASPLAAAFGGLRAGQVVMLGSVTPPLWLSGPTTVKVQFPPLPTVTLRLT